MAGRSPFSSEARKTAFCGIFAALEMVILYFGGLTVLDLSILVVCSVITVFVAIEAGDRTAYVFCAATSVLALIILPSKLYAIEYILFSALYPMLKPHFEKLPKAAAFIVKILFLDLMLLICILVGQFVLNVGDEFYSLGVITMVAGTLFFAVYDYALTKCIYFYLGVLRKRLKIHKLL